MLVIINEFEIIVEPPQQPPDTEDMVFASPAPAVQPRDIEQIVNYFRERRLRLHAD